MVLLKSIKEYADVSKMCISYMTMYNYGKIDSPDLQEELINVIRENYIQLGYDHQPKEDELKVVYANCLIVGNNKFPTMEQINLSTQEFLKQEREKGIKNKSNNLKEGQQHLQMGIQEDVREKIDNTNYTNVYEDNHINFVVNQRHNQGNDKEHIQKGEHLEQTIISVDDYKVFNDLLSQIQTKVKFINQHYLQSLYKGKNIADSLHLINDNANISYNQYANKYQNLEQLKEQDILGSLTGLSTILQKSSLGYINSSISDIQDISREFDEIAGFAERIDKQEVEILLEERAEFNNATDILSTLNVCKNFLNNFVNEEEMNKISNVLKASGSRFFENGNLTNYIANEEDYDCLKDSKDQINQEESSLNFYANRLDKQIKNSQDSSQKDEKQEELDSILDGYDKVVDFKDYLKEFKKNHIKNLKDARQLMYDGKKDMQDLNSTLMVQQYFQKLQEDVKNLEKLCIDKNIYLGEQNEIQPKVERVSIDVIRDEQKEMGITEPEVLVQKDKPLTPEELKRLKEEQEKSNSK